MKILKYIFLLLLLSFISFSVFIATQKGTFHVVKSSLIHASKVNTFNYVNDFQNWEDFMNLGTNESVRNSFTKNSIGKGAKYSWEGTEENGSVQTFLVKENDSISQKMDLDGSEFHLTWIFKDTIGGTKVTMKSKGEMSFSYKIYTALHGGASKIIGNLFGKSLANLDRNLNYEINTYTIKIGGLVRKLSSPYLKQTFTCKISAVAKNSKIVFPKLLEFCEQNKILLNGQPFIIYHTYDIDNGLTKISVCVPIKEAIITSDGSDILADELDSFQAIKTTLYGDYSHTKETLKKSKAYINQKVITPGSQFSHIAVYSISKKETKHPSKWKTDFYFPVQIKNNTPKKEPEAEVLPTSESNETEIN